MNKAPMIPDWWGARMPTGKKPSLLWKRHRLVLCWGMAKEPNKCPSVWRTEEKMALTWHGESPKPRNIFETFYELPAILLCFAPRLKRLYLANNNPIHTASLESRCPRQEVLFWVHLGKWGSTGRSNMIKICYICKKMSEWNPLFLQYMLMKNHFSDP